LSKKKKISKDETDSTQHELVKCDLEFPGLVKSLATLTNDELEAFMKSINKIQQMTWAQIYATSSKGAGKRGLNWEVLPGQKTMSGKSIASIRISKKIRARVTRKNEYMIFISLHPDHDSTYDEDGGEII
jgi:hypothetical protein